MIPNEKEMDLLNPSFNAYDKIDFSQIDRIEPHKIKEYYRDLIIKGILSNISNALYNQLMDLYERGQLEKCEYWIKCTLKTHIKKVIDKL